MDEVCNLTLVVSNLTFSTKTQFFLGKKLCKRRSAVHIYFLQRNFQNGNIVRPGTSNHLKTHAMPRKWLLKGFVSIKLCCKTKHLSSLAQGFD